MLTTNFRCDQIRNEHCHVFSHTLVCHLSQTLMFNKPAWEGKFAALKLRLHLRFSSQKIEAATLFLAPWLLGHLTWSITIYCCHAQGTKPSTTKLFWMIEIYKIEQHTLKHVYNWFNTNIYSYLESSGGQSSNLYLKCCSFFQMVA
jgi:hypothetical protein